MYLVSCEHASARIPARFAQLFQGSDRQILRTHRALDLGAVQVARSLAQALKAPLFVGTMSRLLIDFNRSLHHPALLSTWSRSLPEGDRSWLIEQHRKYRAPIEQVIKSHRGPIRHLSIHSFTPVWNGNERQTDIGLLYDPRRKRERSWVQNLQQRLQKQSDWVIHRNAPYRGTSDGFATSLRAQFSESRYLGLELEFNQRWLASKTHRSDLVRLLLQQLDAHQD